MTERRHYTLKDYLYIAMTLASLGSIGWVFKLADAVEKGVEAKNEVGEVRIMAVEDNKKIAVLEAKMDYMVTTLGRIDRRMDRGERNSR